MDPFGNLFSFIDGVASKEGQKVPQDIDTTIEKKKLVPKIKLLQNGCKLCEEGELHGECTQKRKSRGRKTNGEYACDKCDYTCDIRKSLETHIEWTPD